MFFNPSWFGFAPERVRFDPSPRPPRRGGPAPRVLLLQQRRHSRQTVQEELQEEGGYPGLGKYYLSREIFQTITFYALNGDTNCK